MTLDERKRILDKISHTMAVISVDIDNHQSINDLSLNIISENWFRDLINFLDDSKYQNLNFMVDNAPKIDLVDMANSKALQITSTGTKAKIDKTLTALKTPQYSNYDISLYYLKDKPSLTDKNKKEIFQEYGINIDNHLFDRKDLFKKINDLEDQKLLELYSRFFSPIEEKYTDNMILDFAIRHLLSNKLKMVRNYDDDLGSIETTKKLVLNKINDRIKAKINDSLDYTALFLGSNFDSVKLIDLRQLVVDVYYKSLLIEQLKTREALSSLSQMSVQELHRISIKHNLDFNKLINSLYLLIEQNIGISDFNSMEISWIIISYFFEICDIGLRKYVDSQ